MSVLEVDRLCKQYPSFALKDVSFAVEPGEIRGFIGRNGAGKTTTLKCLLNIVHPASGRVRFFGEEFAGHESDIKQRIGFVSGGMRCYGRKRLRTISDVTRRFYPGWDNAAYEKYMRLFKLDDRKCPDELSEGMRVKYALALALSHNAELLLLDEPTGGLDPVSRDELLRIFLELADKGVSIFFSTHITSDLEECADSITYIHGGEILASCALADFVGAYRLLDVPKDAMTDALQAQVIGCKRSKTGYTALVPAGQKTDGGFPTTAASLQEIMVHIEKEEDA